MRLLFSEPFYIITEYACYGNLESVLKNSRQVKESTVSKKRFIRCRIDQQRLLIMAKQVADGMRHIASHKVGLIHLQINPRSLEPFSVTRPPRGVCCCNPLPEFSIFNALCPYI